VAWCPRVAAQPAIPQSGDPRPVPEWLTDDVEHPDRAPSDTPAVAEPAVQPHGNATAALGRQPGDRTGYLEVTFKGSPNADGLAAHGAKVERTIGNLSLVSVPFDRADDVATVQGVLSVRTPADLRAGMFDTARPTVGQFAPRGEPFGSLHQDGLTGAGVKVGIIDYFDKSLFTNQTAWGDILAVDPSRTACFWLGAPCTFGTPGVTHGNNVLEIATDMAPGATYYLVEVGTITDYMMAIDWLVGKGVTIINHSLGGPFDGPGNGTGPSASVVDYAVSKGIAWLNAAGNGAADPQYQIYQGGYWRGTWSDPDNDRWLNFKGTDESLGTYCGALMGLRWSDWGSTRTDYDLYVTDLRYSNGVPINGTTKYIAGNAVQGAPTNAQPLEANDLRWLCNTDSADGPVYDGNGDGFVSLWVQRKSTSLSSGAIGDVIELMVNNGWFEYSNSPGSAAIPFGDSNNPGMLSVGAASFLSDGFSAQGPTNDGRIKPDIAAEACGNTTIEGNCNSDGDGFFGTSASAPYATGMMALQSAILGPTPVATLVRAFRNQHDYPDGATLPNNVVGWGEVDLRYGLTSPTAPEGAQFVPFTPTRIVDTRRTTNVGATEWYGPKPMAPDSAMRIWPNRAVGTYDAVAVVVNVTIVNAQRQGYVQLYPSLSGTPGTSSNVNSSRAGQVVANLAVVPVNPTGSFTLYNNAGGHVIVDILGKFVKTSNEGTRFDPLEQFRVYDTRNCGACGRLEAGVARDIKVLGTGDASDVNAWIPPTGVKAVVVTVTADSPASQQRGYISAVPVGTTFPVSTSTANFELGETVSGTAIVRIADGSDSIRLFSSLATHVQVDVIGYFGPHAPGGLYHPLTPTRFLDTRQPPGSPRPAASAVSTVDVAGVNGVPADAGAIVHNLTVTQSASTGQAKIGGGSTAPVGVYRSLAIGAANAPIANAGITQVVDGDVSITADVMTHRILDVSGWFTPADEPMPAGWLTTVLAPDGTPPLGYHRIVDLSDNGRYVAIETTSVNFLPPSDTQNKVYRWDRQTNTVVRVSVSDNEQLPNDWVDLMIGISADGSEVAFISNATNLVANDLNTHEDLFIRNVDAGTTTRYSLGDNGFSNVFGLNDSQFAASSDLDAFALSTTASLIPEDTDDFLPDVYVFDRSAGTVQLAVDLGTSSVDPLPVVMSRDGDTVLVLRSDSTLMWKRGSGVTTLPDSVRALNADGTIGVRARWYKPQGSNATVTDISTIDLTTGDETFLCTVPNSSRVFIDGEGDTILLDRACGASEGNLWLVENGTETPLIRSWNGATDGLAWWADISYDGSVVAFLSNQPDLLRGIAPMNPWMYVYDPTP